MCMSSQPSPPINKPAYSPEEANTQFITKVKKPDGTEETLPQAGAEKVKAKTSVPLVQPKQQSIRM